MASARRSLEDFFFFFPCFFFFLNEPIAGTPRHVCERFHAKTFEGLSAYCRASIKSYFTPKVDAILKLSNYYANNTFPFHNGRIASRASRSFATI